MIKDKRMAKTVLLAALAALTLIPALGLSGCAKKQDDSQAGSKLVVWSFTDEIGKMTDAYYKPRHPEMTVEYSLTPTEQFPNKLDPVLQSGQGAPDVFGMEDAFVRKYVESGMLLDITDVYEQVKDKMVRYPVDVGSYKGKVYAMAWQATPGAMFYRRSLAKQYFGTDDPAEVQKHFTNIDAFLAAADELKAKSGGKCVVVGAIQDLMQPFKGARKTPWVVDGKFVIDDAMLRFMDVGKTLHEKGEEGRIAQWSEGWNAGMNGTLKDEKGQPIEVFSVFLPTWGLHYVLKNNAPNTAGDWAMIPGPLPYRWGGTWIGAWKNTKNPAGAKEFIRLLTTDDEVIEQLVKDTGDFVGNMNVVNKIKDTFTEPFLGGQNHYAIFAELAPNIDGTKTQGTDQAIEAIFIETFTSYVNGEKTKDKAIEAFKEQVSAQLGIQ
ncbi:MAG: ABC transporter substrate-binding protein [Spirochaetaceae bacterium]|jgi:ABC-type glycerol-3-phosphate transport system substrate-binding protein|nr:ABC transporter substrate-binding protein [Spirochaetaceae bacterium]